MATCLWPWSKGQSQDYEVNLWRCSRNVPICVGHTSANLLHDSILYSKKNRTTPQSTAMKTLLGFFRRPCEWRISCTAVPILCTWTAPCHRHGLRNGRQNSSGINMDEDGFGAKGPFKSNLQKNTLLFCDKILGFCTKTRIFPSSLQHSNGPVIIVNRLACRFGHFGGRSGKNPWFTADFCLQKSPVAPHSSDAKPSPISIILDVSWFFSIQTLLPGITFRSTKQTKSMMPFAMLPSYWMCGCTCICIYYKYIYQSIYTDRIYMICSPSNSHHHNKTLHFSATAEIPDKSTRCPSPISVESVGSFVGRHPLHNRTSMLLSLTPCDSYSSFGATRKWLGDSKKTTSFTIHHWTSGPPITNETLLRRTSFDP